VVDFLPIHTECIQLSARSISQTVDTIHHPFSLLPYEHPLLSNASHPYPILLPIKQLQLLFFRPIQPVFIHHHHQAAKYQSSLTTPRHALLKAAKPSKTQPIP